MGLRTDRKTDRQTDRMIDQSGKKFKEASILKKAKREEIKSDKDGRDSTSNRFFELHLCCATLIYLHTKVLIFFSIWNTYLKRIKN